MNWLLGEKAGGVQRALGVVGLIAAGLFIWSAENLKEPFQVDPAALGGGYFGGAYTAWLVMTIVYFLGLVLVNRNLNVLAMLAAVVIAAVLMAVVSGTASAILPDPNSSYATISLLSGISMVVISLLAAFWQ